MYRTLAALTLIVTVPSAALAQQTALAADCANELKTYCAQVLPGGDRLVACIIAYEDKVSPRCQLTAYLASGTLGTRMKELQALGKICSADILQYCSTVPPGGGRIYDCLKSHKATLNDECRKIVPRFETIIKN
jgi:Golgi apparatus protein 1